MLNADPECRTIVAVNGLMYVSLRCMQRGLCNEVALFFISRVYLCLAALLLPVDYRELQKQKPQERILGVGLGKP